MLLMRDERKKFLAEDWPRIRATIHRLGLEPRALLEAPPDGGESSNPTKEG
jgi:hypothetical protein